MGLLGIFGVRSARRPLAPSGIPRARRQLRVREISGALHSASKQFGRTEEQLAQRFAFSSSIIPVFQRSFFLFDIYKICTHFWSVVFTTHQTARLTCYSTLLLSHSPNRNSLQCVAYRMFQPFHSTLVERRTTLGSFCSKKYLRAPPFAPALQTSQNSAKRF